MGVERDEAINAKWLLHGDSHIDFFDGATSTELLSRHPSVNEDRGDDVDIEVLSTNMEKDGWVEGVGGAPFYVENTTSRVPGAKWLIGGASRADAFYKAYKRNPKASNLIKSKRRGVHHCREYKKFTPWFILCHLKKNIITTTTPA